ncbi:MAG: FAD-binding oxidoreductase [archaeon]
MDKALVSSLETIVGKNHVITERERMQNYLLDETVDLIRPKPAADLVLVKPANAQEISEVLRLANEKGVPVFPRGGGTGIVGGAIPTQDGIILSMERMNKIQIDKENLMAVAEAGVTLESLMSSAGEAGLFFPPHPGDENAQIGGLIVTNAGGSRAIKHGVMRNHVKGLEAVLPTGEILTLGGKLHKNNVGFDLMQLIMGSEGVLAVVTRAIVRLQPKPAATATLVIPYNSRHDALASVPMICQSGRTPLAIEYVERDLMERTARHLGETWPAKSGDYYLIIILAESSRDQVLSESLKIDETCRRNRSLESLFVEQHQDQDRILRIRSNIYSSMKSETADILDVTVPPSELASLMDRVEEVAAKENTHMPMYGHAADGNLHVHILRRDAADTGYIDRLRDEVYRAALNADGVITGEHGIGKIRAPKLELYVTQKEIQLMKKIKKVFDPNNILNPGTKILI